MACWSGNPWKLQTEKGSYFLLAVEDKRGRNLEGRRVEEAGAAGSIAG